VNFLEALEIRKQFVQQFHLALAEGTSMPSLFHHAD